MTCQRQQSLQGPKIGTATLLTPSCSGHRADCEEKHVTYRIDRLTSPENRKMWSAGEVWTRGAWRQDRPSPCGTERPISTLRHAALSHGHGPAISRSTVRIGRTSRMESGSRRKPCAT
jgi:hypothetical protein